MNKPTLVNRILISAGLSLCILGWTELTYNLHTRQKQHYKIRAQAANEEDYQNKLDDWVTKAGMKDLLAIFLGAGIFIYGIYRKDKPSSQR